VKSSPITRVEVRESRHAAAQQQSLSSEASSVLMEAALASALRTSNW
jgi:hypothetical protein